MAALPKTSPNAEPVGEAAQNGWTYGQPVLPRHWAALSAPFGEGQLERLPRNLVPKDENKGRCEAGTRYTADDYACGGWHARSIHLTYVGHAGVTDRLNEVDPTWNWEPVAFDAQGLPLIANGGLWIRLTVFGVTRLGFGDAPGKRDATKELIGDAIRNAAMRFGVGTYLWSKSNDAKVLAAGGDLDAERDKPPAQTGAPQNGGPVGPAPERQPWQEACVEAWNHLSPAAQEVSRNHWPEGAAGPANIAREHAEAALDVMARAAQGSSPQGAPDPT